MRLVFFCPLAAIFIAIKSVAIEAPVMVMKKIDFKKSRAYKDYKVTEIPKYEIPAFLTREDMNKIVPKDVSANDPSNDVLKKMSDKAVQVWLKSSAMKDNSIVQTANKVENAMKAEVALGTPTEEGAVQHKLNFQVLAFQSLSKVDYKGYVNATVSYNAREHKSGIEFREKILKNKDLFVNHTSSKDENLSSVGLKWAF